MSQESKILSKLQRGYAITPIDALRDFGCFRLAARVYDLKSKGYDIVSTQVKRGQAEVAQYTLRGVWKCEG